MVNADPAFVQELNDETSFCYTDASHLRISNIRLTYNFPRQWMKVVGVQSAALSFSCDNVYTFASKFFSVWTRKCWRLGCSETFYFQPECYILMVKSYEKEIFDCRTFVSGRLQRAA